MSGQGDELSGRLILGRYRIVRRLARGGMGVVYLARAEGAAGFVKPVVVKRILPDLTTDEKMVKMFVREARILSNLHHPGIVGVIDFGEQSDAYIMVLEYVHGYHLGRWARYKREKEGFFPAHLGVQIIIDVLSALHYAHTRTRPDGRPLGIVHRDISPSNVFVDTEGHVKLLDFGIGRMTGDASEYKTQEVTLKGKLAYLGPELLHGNAPTPQSDVYSTGVVLHELLMGKNEFRGREMSDTVARVLNAEPASVESFRSDAPVGIDAVLKKALSKKPDDRFASAADFAQALRDLRVEAEADAQARITEQVHMDFFGALPQTLGLESLEELDDAWRNPPPAIMQGDGDTEPIPLDIELGGETVVEQEASLAATEAGEESAGRRMLRTAALVALVAVSAAGAAVLAVSLQQQPSPAPAGIMVVDSQRQATAEPTADLDEAPPPASAQADGGEPAAEDAGEADGPTEAPGGAEQPARQRTARRAPARRKADPQSLTRAFAKKQGQIAACIQRNTEHMSGAPQISVRFGIDASGKVTSAQILPPSVAGTALGACLLAVARSTQFPPQPAPIPAFRIPITARRSH